MAFKAQIVVVAVLFAALSSQVLTGPPVAEAAPSVGAPVLLNTGQAMAQAKRSGQPVVATALTDEHTLVTADPTSGLMVAEMSAGLARVSDGKGGWREPSATLVQAPDGGWHPEAAAAQVTISNGGAGSFLNLADGGGSLSFNWAGSLPAPVVSGNLATYAEVAPGVDLVVRASVDGAESFLVVKNAQAAQSSVARSVPITVTTPDLKPTSSTNGAVSYADGAGKGHFMLPPAYMWDSAGQVAGAKMSDRLDPAEGAKVSALPATVSKAAKSASFSSVSALASVSSLLDDPNTVYPVVIDPAASLDETYAVRVTQTFVKYNSDIGDRGKIGYNGWTSPYYKSRMFYQFKWPSYLGVYVVPAQISRVEFKYLQTHSPQHDCSNHTFGPSVKVQFYNVISSSTKWDGPDVHTGIGSKLNDYAVGSEDYCGNTHTQTWDVTSMALAERASSSTRTTVTVGIISSDESDKNGWREYKNGGTSPTLTVFYDPVALVPSNLAVSDLTPLGGSGVTRSSGPTISATVTTQDGQCSDRLQQQCLSAKFVVERNSDHTVAYQTNTTGVNPNTRVSAVLPAGTLTDNTQYSVTAQACNIASGLCSAVSPAMSLLTDFPPGPSTITGLANWSAGHQLTVNASNADSTVSYRWQVTYIDADQNQQTDVGSWSRGTTAAGDVVLAVGNPNGYPGNGHVSVTIWPIDTHGSEGQSSDSGLVVLR